MSSTRTFTIHPEHYSMIEIIGRDLHRRGIKRIVQNDQVNKSGVIQALLEEYIAGIPETELPAEEKNKLTSRYGFYGHKE